MRKQLCPELPFSSILRAGQQQRSSLLYKHPRVCDNSSAPRKKSVFRRKVLDHVTSPKYTDSNVYIPQTLCTQSSGIVYFLPQARRSFGHMKAQPLRKCKRPVAESLLCVSSLGKTQLWRLSQKCPHTHKPQPPDSWRRNGRTCPGILGCQFSLQLPSTRNTFV